MNNLFNSQFWVLFAVFGAGFLSWIIRQIQEQARIRAARDRARRQYEEQLRTGRPPEPAPERRAEAGPVRGEDLLARRQAQLQELRRRQGVGVNPLGSPIAVRAPNVRPSAAGAAAAQRGAGAIPPAGVVIQRIPGGGPVPARRPAKARTPAPAARPALTGDTSASSVARKDERSSREALMRQLEVEDRARLEVARRRREAQATQSRAEELAAIAPLSELGRSPFHSPDGALRPRAQIRQLVIAAEVLRAPLSLREAE